MPSSDGRLLVYLDQNILGCIAKGWLPRLRSRILRCSSVAVVCSDATLEETERITDSALRDRVFRALDDLKAWLLVIPTEDGKQAYFRPLDLENYLEHWRASNAEGEDASRAFLDLAHTINAPPEGTTVGEYGDLVANSLDGILDVAVQYLEKAAAGLHGDEPQMVEMRRKLKAAREQAQRLPGLYAEQARKSKLSPDEPAGLDSLRKGFRLTPAEVSGIQPPSVIEKIWGLMLKRAPDVVANLSMEEFFVGDDHGALPSGAIGLLRRAVRAYSLLNTFGYHADKKLHDRSRFDASLRDHRHVRYAAYCDVLVSMDKRALVKAEAVYEFIGARTRCVRLALPPSANAP